MSKRLSILIACLIFRTALAPDIHVTSLFTSGSISNSHRRVFFETGQCVTATEFEDGTTGATDVLGYDDLTHYMGTEFTASNNYTPCKVVVRLSRTGSPIQFTIAAAVYLMTNGIPSVQLSDWSAEADPNSVAETEDDFTIADMAPYAVTNTGTYMIALRCTGILNQSGYMHWASTFSLVDSEWNSVDGVTWGQDNSFTHNKFTLYK